MVTTKYSFFSTSTLSSDKITVNYLIDIEVVGKRMNPNESDTVLGS